MTSHLENAASESRTDTTAAGTHPNIALVERLRFDARWHDITGCSGWKVSTDEMKDSAKLEREAADRIEQLERELTNAKRDAGRYRWLRDSHPMCNLFIKDQQDATHRILGTPMLDAAIDTAMQKEPQAEVSVVTQDRVERK